MNFFAGSFDLCLVRAVRSDKCHTKAIHMHTEKILEKKSHLHLSTCEFFFMANFSYKLSSNSSIKSLEISTRASHVWKAQKTVIASETAVSKVPKLKAAFCWFSHSLHDWCKASKWKKFFISQCVPEKKNWIRKSMESAFALLQFKRI